MAALDAGGPNADQIAYWNEAGLKWVAVQTLIDTQIRPLGHLAMQRAALAPGERVLDIGCGCGDTSLELARRVAPGGQVLGADISAPMLERARASAAAASSAAEFVAADAQTHPFAPGAFDVAFSRFGVMFFADPPAAFANLRRALRPGGRLAFVCWQAMPDNPWAAVPCMAALPLLPAQPMPNPEAPGPFAFANPERVRDILARAGFTDVALESVRMPLSIGGGQGLDPTVDFLLKMGPLARALREAADPALVGRVAARVREVLEPYLTAEGVRMDSASWLVTARSA